MANNDVNPKVSIEFTKIIDSFNYFKSLVYLAEFYPNEESKNLLFNKLYELEHILQQNYVDIIKGVKKETYDSVYYDKTICSECKHDLDRHEIKCKEIICDCMLSYKEVLDNFHETIRVGKEVTKDEL